MLDPAATYDQLTAGFRWNIPDRYNMATHACDTIAAREPDRLALVHIDADGRRMEWSYSRLQAVSSRMAHALAHNGAHPGDRVAILLPQGPETAAIHLACYRAGVIAVPLALLFGVEALAWRLADSGATLVVTNAGGLPKLAAIRDRLPELRAVLCLDGPAEGARDFAAEIERASDRFEAIATTGDDPALMIYTSGTTGAPKGALHGHRVLIGHIPGVQFSQGLMPAPGDLIWTPSDWAWAGGLLNVLMPSLALGVPVLSTAPTRFDPDWAIDLIARHGIRNVFFAPTALKMLRHASKPGQRYPVALRSIGAAGEALGSETFEWAREAFGIPVDEFYGQTECNTVLGSCSRLGISRAGTIGRAVPGHEVAILDSNGLEVAPGELGEIAIAAPDPVMFLEYWRRPDATREKFLGRYLLTGDQGVMDPDGYVRFVGRDDDVITSAAYRIGPAEIEDCLIGHPAIELAAVVGKPDPIRSEVVKAYVRLAPGTTGTDALAAEIRAFVRDRLSAHQYPREIAFVDDIPLTTSGKVVRRLFRERARAEAAEDAARRHWE